MDELDISHLDASSEIMIAEHQRLAELYLYNSEMGEKRTSLYVSIVSLGAAGLIGLAQFVDTPMLVWPANIVLTGMIVLGALTFQRLIERRVRAVENLRALNRIHRYFVDKDSELADYFYWPPCDDVPPFRSKGGIFAGLRDVIAFINSLFGGFLTGEVLAALWPGLHSLAPVSAGIVAGLLLWFLHQIYERRALGKANQHAILRDIKFPKEQFKASKVTAPENKGE
ncbi:MAG: hypothetical protein JXA78_10530 [Anaerolineales bacterium]|nr:hypothetical protein [Anaerolineales bacterium]